MKHLDAATGLYASQADQQVVRAIRSRESYRSYLERALGFERGLESALARAATFDFDVTARAKSPLIAADLVALGASTDEILKLPICDVAGDLHDSIDGLAWLYVAERASFAHALAAHHVKASMATNSTTYFDALLARTAWEHVLVALRRVDGDASAVEQLIASAVNAFRAQRVWFGDAPKRQTDDIDRVDLSAFGAGDLASESEG